MNLPIRFCAKILFLYLLLPASNGLLAQRTFPSSAPSDVRDGAFAFTNATIWVDYKTRIEGATLVVRKGKVEACGQTVTVPKDAVVADCSGKTIYPSFLDIYATGYGLPAPKAEGQAPAQRPQEYSNKKGAYAWNEALKPEFHAGDAFSNDPKAADEWRKIGFGALLTHRADGIARGTGVLVALSDEREHEAVLAPRAANYLSFRKGTSTQDYPSSLMGCIALIRQTYLDADWYKTAGYKEEKNNSLEAWNAVQGLPQIFEASDKLDVLRINSIGAEFGKKYLIKTNGDEYQRIAEIKAGGAALIVPLNFPEASDVNDPYDAVNISLKDLKHWEMAPANPARLAAAGIPFAFTASDLRDKKSFLENLRKAVEYGLSEENALKALTEQPARLINAYDQLGSLEPGKTANFLVTTGNIFKAETKIREHWVRGKKFEVEPDKYDGKNLTGVYQLSVGADRYTLTVKGKPESPEAGLMRADSSKLKASLSYGNGLVALNFQPDSTVKAFVSLTGEVKTRSWAGRGTLPDGSWTDWKAERTGDAPPDRPRRPEKEATPPETGDLIYPFVAFGWKEQPKQGAWLVRNATVWTSEQEGVLQNTDVYFADGKIQRIGRNLPVPAGATVIDGTGKYLTAGIIDEHSHIAATRGVNEGGQESSAEVRIADVLNSEDIDIYRQLAGGVTSSHILHGSANPIGGQTQLIKLRWGVAPEGLKFRDWPGFIKFALGENVKSSNGGDNSRASYPQTRMGVEQVFTDYFTRAQEYGRLKKSGKPYRKDLEMEALLEILESRRFITCHSYVQSEITMMMRVAEKFGFRLNTFTHILEGYKVADKMRKHGAGGSSFSDWWAYKYEVFHAIPYNAAIMQKQGVTVAINSDDAEMARRLNQEAAKTVLYGGAKEEEAWKMVTINPAKLLHVDDRVGSIKAGKDADLVLWNNNPLSVYARPEKTWVDGIDYFDLEKDAGMQDGVQKERARLVAKMQAAKKPGEGGERPARRTREHYHCDSMEDEGN
ncbi:MAG: amidohydrolase family protein [Thermoanaerobaculia bacterium]|nr:amidohydrolase family protein [Thermoanaerobaculia bacterium]